MYFNARLRLAPYLAEFFPIDIWMVSGICGSEKNLAKNLKLKTTTVNEPRSELILFFIQRNHNTCHNAFTRSFRVKHVVCSPSKVVLDLI